MIDPAPVAYAILTLLILAAILRLRVIERKARDRHR